MYMYTYREHGQVSPAITATQGEIGLRHKYDAYYYRDNDIEIDRDLVCSFLGKFDQGILDL